jgi:quercetin dioxygenase-like cupin family protein
VVWSAAPAGVHVNLVVLDGGESIAPHRNDAVDVLVVVLDGSGTAAIDSAVVELAPTTALLIPEGTLRSIEAGAEGLRYLTIHAHRGPLTIAPPERGTASE